LVVAPTYVHAELLGWNVCERVVERLDVQAQALAEFLERETCILDMAAHGQIGAIDLQHDAGLGHRLVLVAHGVRNGEEIRLLARVMVVPEEERYHTRRGGTHEGAGRLRLSKRRLEVSRVRRCRLPVT